MGAAQFAVEQSAAAMKASVDNVFELLPYISKPQRALAIGKLAFGDDVKRVFYEYADLVPEPQPLPALQALATLKLRDFGPPGTIFQTTTSLEQDETKGIFDVKPPGAPS